MEPFGPKLSSLASLPRLHYDSTADASSSPEITGSSRQLAGRAVYPVTLRMVADCVNVSAANSLPVSRLSISQFVDSLVQDPGQQAFVSVQLQHDEVMLWLHAMCHCSSRTFQA